MPLELVSIPSGTSWLHNGFTAPTGWLLEDGSAVSRTTYAALFAVIAISTTGTTHSTNVIDSIPSTTNMAVGMPISGPGIPVATTVASITSGTAITISHAATSSGVGVAIVVAPFGIGDGSTTFNVPDSRGRAAIGAGAGSGLTARTLGATGGEENHTMTINEMPIHNHASSDSANWVTDKAGGNTVAIGGTQNINLVGLTTQTGNGAPHNNMQPWVAKNWIIKT